MGLVFCVILDNCWAEFVKIYAFHIHWKMGWSPPTQANRKS